MRRADLNVLRQRRLTSGAANVIMHGGADAWNSLALDLMRDSKPISDVPSPKMPAPLRWGLEQEPYAIARFWEAHPQWTIEEKAWLYFYDEASPLYPHVGSTPDVACFHADQLVTGVEVKCPWSQERFAQKLRDRLPPGDKAQVQWHMWMSGVASWYYVLFDPRDDAYHEFVWPRDDAYIDVMATRAQRFLDSFLEGKPFVASKATASEILKL